MRGMIESISPYCLNMNVPHLLYYRILFEHISELIFHSPHILYILPILELPFIINTTYILRADMNLLFSHVFIARSHDTSLIADIIRNFYNSLPYFIENQTPP